jgi:hypothetical protein
MLDDFPSDIADCGKHKDIDVVEHVEFDNQPKVSYMRKLVVILADVVPELIHS